MPANHVDLIGVPFKVRGRGPDSFDCYGLVMEMSRRDGIVIPDFGAHSDQGVVAALVGEALPQWEETKCDRGAVALFRIGRYVSHVGYMLDRYQMIHSWERSGGVLVEPIANWKLRLVGFYKYVGPRSAQAVQ